jgi:hypothetical protein
MIPADEIETIPSGPVRRPVAPVLYALIKRRSKYAYQGERDGRPVLMRVTHLEEDAYAFHLDNGNRYRREDLTFFAQGPEGKPFKLT